MGITRFISLKNVSLFLFVLGFFIGAYGLLIDNNNIVSFVRVFGIVALAVYYVTCVEKVNYYFLAVLALIALSGYVFAYDNSSTFGFFLIALYRTILLGIVYFYFKQRDVTFFTLLFIAFSVIAFFILSQISRNNLRFYLVVYIAFLLISMFSILIINLLYVKKRGVFEMFLGISLFIFSDVIFSLNSLKILGSSKFIIISLFYHVTYFLITIAIIKKSRKRKIPSRTTQDF